jgi:hypothetical protein
VNRQINVRVEPAVYQIIAVLARQERRSVAQMVRQLMEDGLRQRALEWSPVDDTSRDDIAALASAGGAFDWLAEEPDLYDDTCGEPL